MSRKKRWERIVDLSWAIASLVCILSLTLIALHSVLAK